MPRKKEAESGYRKPSDALSGLNLRQARYVGGLADGKTKKQAALEAGYSLSTSENAAAIIEGRGVRAAFEQLVQDNVDANKVVQRLAEGLDATESKFFQHNGQIVETREVVDYGRRREYIALAAKLGGYHVDKAEIAISNEADNRTDEELIAETRQLLEMLEKKK